LTLGRLWAGWRSEYLSAPEEGGCVFCRILASNEAPDTTLVLRRTDHVAAVLNAYPYTSGHLMVMPTAHIGEIEDVAPAVAADLWALLTDATRALKKAYGPDGVNVGANIGRAAGAGVPDHLHLHCVPRWIGDTSFMTTTAEARVMPEALSVAFAKLTAAWPD